MSRALVFNDDESEFLYMLRTPDGTWHADMTMLEHCRFTEAPQPRTYRIDEDNFVTVVTEPLHWVRLPYTEYPNVRTLVQRPWLPADAIYTGIPVDEILAFDVWNREPAAAASVAAWNEPHRPRLEEPRGPWEPYTVPPTVQPQPQPQPSAPPVAAQQPQSLRSAQSPPPAALPPHIVALVVANAVATGATCPITMEPITAAEAAVTHCGHVFQAAALQTWLLRHPHCPECRAPVV